MTFEKIYQTYYTELWRYALYISGNHFGCEDLLQEAFTKLFHEIQKKGLPENYRAWLYKVLSNDVLTLKSKEKRHRNKMQVLKQGQTNDVNPFETIQKDERTTHLLKALNTLTKKERILLSLYNNEFSYDEISKITGIKKTSVGKTISRVIAKLKNELKQRCYELFE